MAHKPKPDRTDVVIIGAGASGAAAAKVLTERGLRVVALEKGPWRKKETFGGDELANINRYNLWPDPLTNPRTHRTSASEEAKIDLFCPVPQMVGGGTVHWQGWLPRFTPNDFRLRTIVGELPGTTLVDWPVTYDDLEPYYTKVEWAFGVSGQAGANKFEGARSQGYPCPPLPMSRYAQKFHEGCANLGYNSFPTPQAALSRPFNGRKRTVISAFAQQHGDPTGTRSSGQLIGDVLAGLVNFFNPSHIFIGGGIANFGNHLLVAIRRAVLRRSLPLATTHLSINFSRAGAEAGVNGALALALDYLFMVADGRPHMVS